MPIKIKNWKLLLLSVVLMALFLRLGFWQLSRAHEKTLLLKSYAARTQHPPLHANDLLQLKDWRFYRITLQGQFDNDHTVLLDNKTHDGKIGYEVYTPFVAQGLTNPILVDRGFIPIFKSRRELPTIKSIPGVVTLMGMLNTPPTYVSLGSMRDPSISNWPARIEYLNLTELADLISQPLHPAILNLSPDDPAAYAIEWQVVIMSPEKHQGYAVQWFAFALTLLILSVALNTTVLNIKK